MWDFERYFAPQLAERMERLGAQFSTSAGYTYANAQVTALKANFPDALAGAPLAGLTGGPVLLTTYDGLPDVVERELVRLKPHRVVILGGRSVVNGVVYNRLIQLESAPDWDLSKLD